jgi:hypothetical protein
MVYRFGNIRERDIDLMLLYSFSMEPSFLEIFTNKLNRADIINPSLIDVELSKNDPAWGETDVTVRFESRGRKYALLIEDKIGAEAQPDQCRRYFKRGEIAVEQQEYEEFFVFICASADYLATNEEAKKYPFSISLEELKDFFCKRDDIWSIMQSQLIEQAIGFSKIPYKKIVDDTATSFWKSYVEYQRRFYPDLQLPNKSMEKSRDGAWAVYDTPLHRRNSLYIHHKMDRGYVDLTFNGMADRQPELAGFLKEQIGDYEQMGFGIRPAGKSAVLRKDLGKDNRLDFQKPFEEQMEIVELHFQALHELHRLAAQLDREKLIELEERENDLPN